MSVPYASATTGLKAREEITRLLRRFGCEQIGFMDDYEKRAFETRGLRMKTILVPIHNIVAMTSALETAVLLAKRTGAYIEGFPLRFSINQFVVSELATGFSFDSVSGED